MTFSNAENTAFNRLLKAWNSREDLRAADAPATDRLDATIAIDHARRALVHSPHFAHAA